MEIITANLGAAGNLMERVSSDVSSSEYAITELIKNSYEAGSTEVQLEIYEDKIIIKDNGTGMNAEKLNKLLILGYSDKKFGEKINGRLIIGEKGLGFFSAFKLGKSIEVVTYNSTEEFSFKLDLEEIGRASQLTKVEVPISKTTKKTMSKAGTEITITHLDLDNKKLLDTIWSDEIRYSKLINVVDSHDFSVKIVVNGENIKYNPDYNKIKDKKIGNASFNSSIKLKSGYQIKIIDLNNNENTLFVDKKYKELFENKYFKIEMEIDYFKFGSGVTKNF